MTDKINPYDINTKIGKIYQMFYIENKGISEIMEVVKQPRKVVTNQIGEIRRKHKPIEPKIELSDSTKKALFGEEIKRTVERLYKTEAEAKPEPSTEPTAEPSPSTEPTAEPEPRPTAEAIKPISKPDYSPELLKLIPQNNFYYDIDGYVEKIRQLYRDNLSKEIGKNEMLNVLLYGEAGTGKTEIGINTAYLEQLPLWDYCFNGETSTDNLLGYNALEEKDGKNVMVWRDGILTKAFRFGGILLLNEINAINPNVSIKLNQALEKGRKLILDENNSEVIHAHKNLMVIGTMNNSVKYAGTNEMSIALLDRFGVKIEVKYNTKLETLLHKKGLIHSEKIIKFAEAQREAYFNDEFKIPVSTRTLIILSRLVKIFGEFEAYKLFLNNFTISTERHSIAQLLELYTSINPEAEVEPKAEPEPEPRKRRVVV